MTTTAFLSLLAGYVLSRVAFSVSAMFDGRLRKAADRDRRPNTNAHTRGDINAKCTAREQELQGSSSGTSGAQLTALSTTTRRRRLCDILST